MRYAAAIAILAAVMPVLADRAEAATGLASVPMVMPSGGVACSCVNVTAETIDVVLRIGDSGIPHLTSLSPGGMANVGQFPEGGTLPMTYCKVFRQGGGKLSAKHLACSLSSVDGDGNPTVVVPLDRKIKE
jgi:hypothetical protein